MAAPKRPQYPRVGNIKDPDIKETIRLLWDQMFDHRQTLTNLNDTLTTANATITSQAATIADLQGQVVRLAPAQGTDLSNIPVGTVSGGSGSGSTGGSGSGSGSGSGGGGSSTDNGQGALGCSQAGGNGHLTPPFNVDLVAAGEIICGVGNEFPTLLAIAIDQPTRDANQSELLNRMVWHMNQQGFPCSRYPTTNGRPWILLFNVGSTQYAYRVIDYSAGDYTIPYTTTMVYSGQTANQSTPPDGGTPD